MGIVRLDRKTQQGIAAIALARPRALYHRPILHPLAIIHRKRAGERSLCHV